MRMVSFFIKIYWTIKKKVKCQPEYMTVFVQKEESQFT